jgi:hypothetical protein
MWLWRRACGCAASRAVSALVGEQKKRENDERNRFARSIEPRRWLDRASVFRPSPSFEHVEDMEEARVVHGGLFFRWESSSSLNRQLTGASGAHCD